MPEEVELDQRELIDVKNDLQHVKRYCQEMQRNHDMLQKKYDQIIRIMLESDHDYREKLHKAFVSEKGVSSFIEPQHDGVYASSSRTMESDVIDSLLGKIPRIL